MSRETSARLFVAVDVPAAVRNELVAWARSAAAALETHSIRAGFANAPLRLVAPEAMHITLCFFGTRPVEEIERIAKTILFCAAPVGELSLGAPLWLPPRNPRALAVEMHDDSGLLASLRNTVSRALCDAIDWQPGRSHFRPHITVGRVRGHCRAKRTHLDDEMPITPSIAFPPQSLTVYRSWLSPAGATYEAIASTALYSQALAGASGRPQGPARLGDRGHRHVTG